MRLKSILAAVALGAITTCVTSASAAYYVAGDFQGWDAGANVMTDNGNGTYTYTVTGLTPSSRHEFKVTVGDWSTSYASSNAWFYADAAGNETITFNTNTSVDGNLPATNRITTSTNATTWTAVGDWQGWSNNNPATTMIPIGGGVYEYSATIPAAGTYQYKAVDSGSWDAIGSDGFGTNAPATTFTTTDVNQTVNMFVNPAAGTINAVVAAPEPASLGLLSVAGLAALRRRRV